MTEEVMESRLNWKWGETSPLCVEVGGTIKAGDLLWLGDDGRCRSLCDFKTTQALAEEEVLQAFSTRFLGVAMQSSTQAGKTVRVATAGAFVFPADEESAESAHRGLFRPVV